MPRRTARDECTQPDDSVAALVRRYPVCIAWTEEWAGELGHTLLFHLRQLGPNRLAVGYFAYWTTERPWGNDSVPGQLLPALAIDAVYSHLFFVMPGLQRVMYGPGDIEGVRVEYELDGSSQLVPLFVFADQANHREVRLDLRDAIDERGRIVVLTNVWSHQLGARGAAAALRAGAPHRCFAGGTLRTVTEEVATAFRLGDVETPRRARPAWRLLPSQSRPTGSG